MREPLRTEIKGLPTRQVTQGVGQLLGIGHPGTFNQDRNDADITFQRCLDLQPHEIIGFIKAPPFLVSAR